MTPQAIQSTTTLKPKCANCINKSCKSLNKYTTTLRTPPQPMATLAASTAAKAPVRVLSSWHRFASVFREAHPIGRMPRYLKAHDLPGASYYFRRLGRAGSMFVPLMVGFFGWPFAMKAMINASNGVKNPKPKKAAPSHKMSRKSSIDTEAWSQKIPA
ncbi:hypothetical protein WHR41_03295 [Cladosporium halotolerans]|uniref:Uncharacterized protein n=1 Tax=Cladosporium halotolerans TaxID=1052096 RepID=A0AB34KSU3_9PEZI